MICVVFYWPIKTDVLFFLLDGLVSQECPLIIAHMGDGCVLWSWEGGELDDVPAMTGEGLPMTGEDLRMTGEVPLTSEVQLWAFGLGGNHDALGWKYAGPGTMRAAGRCPAGNCQYRRRWGSSSRRVGKVACIRCCCL